MSVNKYSRAEGKFLPNRWEFGEDSVVLLLPRLWITTAPGRIESRFLSRVLIANSFGKLCHKINRVSGFVWSGNERFYRNSSFTVLNFNLMRKVSEANIKLNEIKESHIQVVNKLSSSVSLCTHIYRTTPGKQTISKAFKSFSPLLLIFSPSYFILLYNRTTKQHLKKKLKTAENSRKKKFHHQFT